MDGHCKLLDYQSPYFQLKYPLDHQRLEHHQIPLEVWSLYFYFKWSIDHSSCHCVEGGGAVVTKPRPSHEPFRLWALVMLLITTDLKIIKDNTFIWKYVWIGLNSQKQHPIPTRPSKVSRLINRTTRPTGPTRHSSFVTTALVYSFKQVSCFAKRTGNFGRGGWGAPLAGKIR